MARTPPGGYLFRVLPALDLRHRVEGVCVRQRLGTHGQPDHHPLPPGRHAGHELGVLHRDADRRDTPHPLLVVLHACVGAWPAGRKTPVKTVIAEIPLN